MRRSWIAKTVQGKKCEALREPESRRNEKHYNLGNYVVG